MTEKLRARKEEIWDIETIQDTVEETLFEQKYYQTAKAYIRYRLEKEKERAGGVEKEGLLTREFLSPYKHAPSPMEQLGAFVYTRTYSGSCPGSGAGNSGGRPCGGRWNTTAPWRPRPERKRRSCMTIFTICASSFPDVPCGWEERRWRISIRWRTITAPLP